TEHIATPSADAIIRAVRVFARVNDDGQWIEPPSHVIFSSGSRPVRPSAPRPDSIEIPVASDLDPSDSCAHSVPRHAIPRHPANLAPSQIPENTPRRSRYPETHFQRHRARKTKTKANRNSL